jgi:hypothetical protein
MDPIFARFSGLNQSQQTVSEKNPSGPRGLHIPQALFDYYAVAGYHWVNKKQNRLRPIEELDWYKDWLVFMDDDQGLVSWGIHRQDLSSSDPVVWRGILGEEID